MCYVCLVPVLRAIVLSLRALPSGTWARVRAWPRALIAQPGRWPRLLFAAAFALILGMYCTNSDMGGDPTTPRGDGRYRPVLARGDGHMLYLMARSTALDGDWVFDNDLARFGDPWNEPRTPTGRKAIIHPIGAPLIWTPLIWLATAGAAIVNLFGADIPLHGYTLWVQRFVFLSSALAGCFAVFLGLRLAAKLVGGTWAPAYAAVAVLLGTPLTYYATHMPSYAHALDAFTCAAFLAYWAHSLGRRDLRRWLTLGVLLGLAMLIRVQELALGVCIVIEIVAEGIPLLRARDLRATSLWIAGGALILVVALVVFIPQLVEWHVVFGSVTHLPQGDRYTRFNAPMMTELLFSARNGWFSTTPVAYLGCLGLILVPKRARLVGGALLAFTLLQVYLNSTVFDWWSSASFGQRRMCNATLPIVVGLAALIWRCGRVAARARRVPRAVWHAVLWLVLGTLVAWNLAKAIALRGGKPAPGELSPSCCDNIPRPLRGLASIVYGTIGNPFQFPANAIFALRHGVDIRRYDDVVGNYPFVPPWNQLSDAEMPRHRGALRIGSGGNDPLIVSGFSRPATADRPFRWTTEPSATVLVPNLLPYGQHLSLWLAPGGSSHVVVKWNGDEVVARDLGAGWTQVAFDLPAMALHTNELTIEASLGTAPSQVGWPAAPTPVGVAVGDLDLTFLPR